MDLYDVPMFMSLYGFRIGMIFASCCFCFVLLPLVLVVSVILVV